METGTTLKWESNGVQHTAIQDVLAKLRIDRLLIESQNESLLYQETRRNGNLSHLAVLEKSSDKAEMKIELDDLYQEMKGHLSVQINPATKFSLSYENFVATAQLNHVYKKDFEYAWGKLSFIQSTGLAETGRSTLLRSDSTFQLANEKIRSSLTVSQLLNREDSHFSYRAGGGGALKVNPPDQPAAPAKNQFEPLSSDLPETITLDTHIPLLNQAQNGKPGWNTAIDTEFQINTHHFDASTGKLTFSATGVQKKIKSIRGTITYKNGYLGFDLKAELEQSALSLGVGYTQANQQYEYSFAYKVDTWTFNMNLTTTPTDYKAQLGIGKQIGDRGSLNLYMYKGRNDEGFGINYLWRF